MAGALATRKSAFWRMVDRMRCISTDPSYSYEPLTGISSFRILELLPGDANDHISFRLHLADWNHPPPYEALSYAWGDSKDRIALLCDGKYAVEVTRNLLEALLQLRRPSSSRYIWADAACIDQNNLNERAHQVSNMEYIYENASSVLVWLGRDDKGLAGKASHFMQNLAQKCCDKLQIPLEAVEESDNLYSLLPDEAFRSFENGCEESWQVLHWYFSHSWFSRLWVFQEVNAQTKVCVQCGSASSSWHVVGLAATYISKFSEIWFNQRFTETLYINAYIMRSRALHLEYSMPQLLDWARNFKTSDPRDRIYALLGRPVFSKMNPPISVDYRISKLKLYRDIATRCIHDFGDLSVLLFIQHSETTMDSFPSWVPQWDQSIQKSPIGFSKAVKFAAGGPPTSSHVDATVHGSVLHILGVLVDEISAKVNINTFKWFNSADHRMPEHPILTSWKAQRTNPITYCTGESGMDVSALVYTAGTGRLGTEAGFVRAVDNYAEEFQSNFAAYITRLMDISRQDTSEYTDLNIKAQAGSWQAYEAAARTMSWNRSFFTTKKCYMGLGPQLLQPGDWVCVLFGAKVPYILRPYNGNYKLVGEAYLHGVMDGEIVAQYEEGTVPHKLFEIY
jgi:heterokaryon incompatibility protein (HET)